MNKQTDDLIKILSQSLSIRKPLSFGWALVGLTLASLGITYSILGKLRPEFSTLDFPAFFYFKTAILFGFASLGFLFLKESAKPLPKFPKRSIALLPIVVLSLFIVLEWGSASSPDVILSNFLLRNFPACLFFVTTYGLVGIIALTTLMKRYAPADENKAAGWIGFAASAACAVGYSFHCPIDSPTFIAVAYGLPVVTLGFTARFILPKFIRW
ncbi:MAG: hypothetical protein DI551_08315 [Micavibrio aeruginosavorus]|uniref:DUF1109 domain-containing protein n=1 Tax=Micavibrio aeruginosavorus TaxID=349221 RepID=A0A2W5MVD9_9BACT|nr:MAG: hypothetical protein DI551_08315 [Micavibrio aeruginosavorus]